MSLVQLNTPCQICPNDGFDVYGQIKVKDPVNETCNVLSVVRGEKRTMMRNEMSASHGSAFEVITQGKLMLQPDTIATQDSMVIVEGVKMRITSMRHVYTMRGTVDHIAVETTYWGEQ